MLVLKCKIFAPESTYSKDFFQKQSYDKLRFVKKCRNLLSKSIFFVKNWPNFFKVDQIFSKKKYIQEYRISEWADCQVWKFLHPQGWKTPLKLAHGQKFLPPKGRRPAGGKYFFPRANLGGFFNPRDEEIFIPDNHGPFGNCIPVRVNQAIFCYQLW